MSLTPKEVAEAFSGHRFSEIYPYLADEVHWNPVGGTPYVGKQAVIDACDESAQYLATVETRFRSLRTIVGATSVVVDSVADYVEGGGASSTVASCDIYDFVDGLVTTITSYTVELANQDGTSAQS